MADSYEELSKLSADVLKQRYDRIAKSTQEGLSFYREEIARREADAQNQIMLAFTKQVRDMTRWITGMTALVLVLTVLNVFLVWPK
ncbi:hypothetical protein [Rhizobium sp. SYY.PMSO]|uniref:hypothetical protein n=1 Tax=Rhizobium sp. SYY.PMSO TaxID=3382192 RepID=UPI00398F9AD4